MRNNINKIVAIGIGLTIMSGSIIPVFAVETTENNKNISTSTLTNESNSIILSNSTINGQVVSKKLVLTLNQAITATIANSDKLALKSSQIKLYRKKMDLQDTLNDFYEKTKYASVYDFPYDKLKLLEDQTDQSEGFLQDQISNDITSKYNNIILKEIDINKLKTDLEIKTKDFNTLKTKVTVGLATANQLNDKEIEIKTLQDNIKAKEDSLKNNIDYLGVLTGLNLSNYTLDSTINYNMFKINGSVDEYLDNRIDQYLKYNYKIIELTKDYFEELEYDGIKNLPDEEKVPIPDKDKYKTTEASTDESGVITTKSVLDSNAYGLAVLTYARHIAGYESYLDGKYSIKEAKVKLDDSKKSLKNALKESYSTLLDLENKITRLNEQIKSNNTKLRFAKSKVDIGLMTENNYKAEVLKSEDLDTSLRSLINTYNTLKNTIEKPWVLSSN